MQIHIVVHSAEGSQRIACYDGLTAAMEVARILHEESGRRIEVRASMVDKGGEEVSLLCLAKSERGKSPLNGKG